MRIVRWKSLKVTLTVKDVLEIEAKIDPGLLDIVVPACG
jgi:hypothetical protein